MKRLMVDMDEVITTGGFFKAITNFLGEDIDINTVDTYFLQTLLGNRKDEFWESVKDTNFYDGMPLMEDCYEILEKLNKQFDLYIVTAYLWDGNPDCSSNNLKFKYEYLKEKLPFIPTNKYIFTSNKGLMHFDIRIDDRPNNLVGAETKLMFDQWHNRKELEDKDIIRVFSWKEVYNILKDKYNLED